MVAINITLPTRLIADTWTNILWLLDIATQYPDRTCTILITGLGYYLWYLYGHIEVYDLLGKRVPGPRDCFFEWSPIFRIKESRRLKHISQCIKDYVIGELGDGHLAGMRILGLPVVLTQNAEMIKKILTGHHEKFPKSLRYTRAKVFLKEGLVTSSGAKWQLHRRIINKGFAAEKFDYMVNVFINKANQWCSKMQCAVAESDMTTGKGVTVAMNAEMSRLTSAIICETAFSFDLESHREALNDNDSGDKTPFGDVNLLLDELNTRLAQPTDWWYLLDPVKLWRVRKETKKTEAFLNGIVSKRLENRRQTSSKQPNTSDTPRDLLDLLLDSCDDFSNNGNSAGASITPTELSDHLLTFLAAGHETTATTTLWLMYELCAHPAAQARCQAEIDEVLVNRRLPTMSDLLNSFPFLACCVKESMRLHPAATNIGRVAVDGVTLDYGKEFPDKAPIHLKPGTNVVLCLACLHRNPLYWENPDTFDPDRWSESRIKDTMKHNFQFIPFSAGPRNCIGQRFASLELVAIAVSILQKFTMHMSEGQRDKVRFEETIVQTPSNLEVTLQKRIYAKKK
jgi:cytochrome P450